MLNKRGFTLIELVVVLGLFMLIMSVTVNLFISIVRQQKMILSQQEMINQVSYVQDYFTRSLRDPLSARVFKIFLDKDGLLKVAEGDAPPQKILSAKFTVNYVKFFTTTGNHPRFTMVLSVKDPARPEGAPLVTQTTVSQR